MVEEVEMLAEVMVALEAPELMELLMPLGDTQPGMALRTPELSMVMMRQLELCKQTMEQSLIGKRTIDFRLMTRIGLKKIHYAVGVVSRNPFATIGEAGRDHPRRLVQQKRHLKVCWYF